jgi:predicted HAD superfamily Cof-like phosphohydrolase
MDWYKDIQDFHKEVMGDNFPTKPYIPEEKLKNLRNSLIVEEINETLNAMDRNDLVEIADGIVDSIVVLLGTAITYGIDIRPVWDEVHRTNIAKKDGPIREDGKKMKPLGWKKPEIEKILISQGW